MKLFFLLILLLINISCQLTKRVYRVEDIIYNSCTEGYYRIILKEVSSDSIFQVLSAKKNIPKQNIFNGNTIKIKIKPTILSEWDLNTIEFRSNEFDFYCNGLIILRKNQFFYKTKNIKSLNLRNR